MRLQRSRSCGATLDRPVSLKGTSPVVREPQQIEARGTRIIPVVPRSLKIHLPGLLWMEHQTKSLKARCNDRHHASCAILMFED